MRASSPKRTVARLAVCQLLLLSNGVLMAAVGSLAGYALAPSPRLATVPAMTCVLGAALSTLPASFFMKRRGRRASFLLGSSLGMAGGAVGAIAIAVHSFTLLLAGAALMFVCVAIAMSGVTLMHFWWALPLLGVGWNFLHIGGTMLLTEAHRPAEKAKVQGVNDSLVFAVMISSSLTSGVVVTDSGGWAMLTRLTVPFLALTALATSILWFREHRNIGRR